MSALNINFLSGSSVEYDRDLFFRIMQSEDVFLGFARKDPTWGLASLMKIDHNYKGKTWPGAITGIPNDPNPSSKFYDLITQESVPNVGDEKRRVFVGRVVASSTNYVQDITFLSDELVGEISLDYINSEWVRVQGLNPLFTWPVQDPLYPDDKNKQFRYFLFNYAKSFETMVEIEKIQKLNLPSIQQDVKLMYSTTSGFIPSTDLADVGELERTVNILGEVEVRGLDFNFDFDESLVNANFFITTPEGTLVQDNMKYVETVVTDAERVIIMSYPLPTEINRNTGEVFRRTGRLRITTGDSVVRLNVFNESLPVSSMVAPISDKHPPALPLNYLKTSTISKSIFDITGISRVTSSEVSFAKRLDDESEKEYYTNLGFETQVITMDNDVSTRTTYVVTGDRTKAIKYNFDLVMIDKKLEGKSPSDQIYRQLFLCYFPRDRFDKPCVEHNNYTHEALYNYSRHEYDLGTVMYVANQTPIYRKYISGFESFKLII